MTALPPRVTFRDRLAAWRAGFGADARHFAAPLPAPDRIGLPQRGHWLLEGSYLVEGRLALAPGLPPWDRPGLGGALRAATHEFAWLEDLAALGTREARERAREWTFGWIRRFGRGGGSGWVPGIAARRLGRWIALASLVTDGRPDRTETLARAAARTLAFLDRRWAAAEGLDRIHALSAMLQAGLALEGAQRHVTPAAVALGREAEVLVDAQGGIASRSPEDLAEVFILLGEAAQALATAGRPVAEGHSAAVRRMVPVLRALRHGDGGLARFHGGGCGFPDRIERALARAAVPAAPLPGLAMGFARLSAGRTTVIVDAADPPGGPQSHASTLAFELSSGRRPLVISCGSGRDWGAEWNRAGRATLSHATLAIEGMSSSRLGPGDDGMAQPARVLSAHRQTGPAGTHLHLLHAGWAATHGLTHQRELVLAPDGRSLSGIDTLAALTTAEQKRLAIVLRAARGQGVPHSLRFHLHPDVQAELEPSARGVVLGLRNGETWLFRPEGEERLALEPSVCLDPAHPEPRATVQIVLSGVLLGSVARIGWTLAKTEDTPLAIRDLDRDDPCAPLRTGPDLEAL